jgi:hypothetical protein
MDIAKNTVQLLVLDREEITLGSSEIALHFAPGPYQSFITTNKREKNFMVDILMQCNAMVWSE